jgi:hypothetical protein
MPPTARDRPRAKDKARHTVVPLEALPTHTPGTRCTPQARSLMTRAVRPTTATARGTTRHTPKRTRTMPHRRRTTRTRTTTRATRRRPRTTIPGTRRTRGTRPIHGMRLTQGTRTIHGMRPRRLCMTLDTMIHGIRLRLAATHGMQATRARGMLRQEDRGMERRARVCRRAMGMAGSSTLSWGIRQGQCLQQARLEMATAAPTAQTRRADSRLWRAWARRTAPRMEAGITARPEAAGAGTRRIRTLGVSVGVLVRL